MSLQPTSHTGDPRDCLAWWEWRPYYPYTPAVPYYPAIPYYPAPTYAPMGWQCPKCGMVNAPQITSCPCSIHKMNPMPELPTIWCSDTRSTTDVKIKATCHSHDSSSNPVSK